MKKSIVTIVLAIIACVPVAAADDQAKRDEIAASKKAVAEVVRKAVDEVLAALKNKQLSRLEKRERVMKIIDPLVDFRLMARLSLGKAQWQKMSAKQRAVFTDLYIETIKRSYFDKLDLFTDEIIEFGEPVEKGTKRFSVVTNIVSRGDRVEVAYAMAKRPHATEQNRRVWRVYDFEIEGVSLRRSYLSQYRDFLRERTIEELLTEMGNKLRAAKQKDPKPAAKPANKGAGKARR